MPFHKFFLSLFVLAGTIFLIPAHHDAQAQDSIIERIHYAMPSIVEINVKNAIVVRVPGSTFIDKDTGQLVEMSGVKAAEYNRDGSGVIIDPAGIIVTNAHTVTDGARITIRLIDGTQVLAQPLKVLPEQDLAFLRIDPPYPLTRVEMIPSSSVNFDDEVVTVGSSPFLRQTLSGGRITGVAKHGNPYTSTPPDLFQLNINIYPGDSGGPLFNNKGQLIGLMVAKQAEEDRLCFAIPSDKIIQAYVQLIEEYRTKNDE